MGKEQLADWYDDYWKEHTGPAPGVMEAVWQWIARRIDKQRLVVDLGCGPGRFSRVLYSSGHRGVYQGYDFSAVAISQAKRACDATMRATYAKRDLQIGGVPKYPRAIYVATEFLEHVTNDRGLIRQIPLGCPVLFSVPNFDSAGHVRTFPTLADVVARYRDLCTLVEAATLPVDSSWRQKIFLFWGVRG